MPSRSRRARSADRDDTELCWSRALEVRDPCFFRRRIEWEGISVEGARLFFESPIGSDAASTFGTVQRWLQQSTPILETSLPLRPRHPPFGELWERLAGPAMVQLAALLSVDAAHHYCADRESWGPCAGLHRDLCADLIARLCEICEPTLLAEFNLRRTESDIVFANLAAEDSAPRRTIYCRFLEELRADGLTELTAKFPCSEAATRGSDGQLADVKIGIADQNSY